MPQPIVLQLQADCLDASVEISTLLRKAKLIASKLSLANLAEWLKNELGGYKCALTDLPRYRTGLGAPKFFNPYHGWLDIVISDSKTNNIISTAYLPNPISELEHLITGTNGGFVILGFPAPINDFLHEDFDIPFKCGLHLSKSVLVGALEGVKNSILEWTLDLERQNVIGEGLSFSQSEIQRAQMVTNNIYNSNVGVLGVVRGDARNSHFTSASGEVDQKRLIALIDQIRTASAGLPPQVATAVEDPLNELEKAATNKNASKVSMALSSIRTVLEGAGGNLAAAGILAALGGA